MAISGTGGGTAVSPPAGEGWGASLLAGLPNLLFGIVIASSALIGQIKGIDQNAVGIFQLAAMSVLLLAVLLFSMFRGWRAWSASWLTYMFMFAVILLSLLSNWLTSSIRSGDDWVSGMQVMLFPILLAYLLYKITCADRVRGLLAAVPPMALLWAYFEEFVPATSRALAWSWMFLLAFGASVMILRTRRFPVALGLAMAVPVLGGLPFAYLGVYQGGTLPFSESGPSLLEAVRQYLPFLTAVLAIVLGPQLAAKLRAIALVSAGTAAAIFYRLVLAGVLLGLTATLLHWITVSGGTPRWMYGLLATKELWPIIAAVPYLAGFIALPWAAMVSAMRSGDHPAVLWLAALCFLLPGVPLVILLQIASPALSLSPYVSLLSTAAFAWVLAAASLVLSAAPSGHTR